MTGLVQVAIAGSVAEGEELQAILAAAGIPSALEAGGEDDALGLDDGPLQVLVDSGELQEARDAIEAFTEPDELSGP